jgi:alpha-galactosidase
MWRQLLYQHYVPRLRGEAREPLVTYNLAFAHHGKGIYFLDQATEEGVWPVVQPAVDVGTELFMIDAGWFEGEPWNATLGNWRISRSKYPRGFKPISKALAEGGVEVGVWFAPEIVSDGVPPPDGHQEWIARGGRERLGRLRLEIPEARDWFVRQVDAIVEHEGMTCYRTDISPGRYLDSPGARKGITEIHHIEGLYALWDALVDHHPALIMEGCCGGGRRIDLETVSRFHWIQKSDRWFDSESDQCSLYGANLYLPGGYLILYTEAMDDYGAWSSFGGVLSIAWHLQDEDFPMSQAKLQIERYKRVRPLLSGDFYPLAPCSQDAEWIGYQFHRADLDAGFALVFRRSGERQAPLPASSAFTARLRGLAPDRQYQVKLEHDGVEQLLSGADLSKGIDIVIATSPGAEMIAYGRA